MQTVPVRSKALGPQTLPTRKMPKTFPFDTYSRIITYKCRNLSTKKVKEQLRSRVSESTIYRCFKRYQLLGVIKPNCNKGLKYRTRKFNTSALESLQALFAEVETLYLDEAAAILTNVLGVCVNPCGVSRACKELGLSRKKVHACRVTMNLHTLSRFYFRSLLHDFGRLTYLTRISLSATFGGPTFGSTSSFG